MNFVDNGTWKVLHRTVEQRTTLLGPLTLTTISAPLTHGTQGRTPQFRQWTTLSCCDCPNFPAPLYALKPNPQPHLWSFVTILLWPFLHFRQFNQDPLPKTVLCLTTQIFVFVFLSPIHYLLPSCWGEGEKERKNMGTRRGTKSGPSGPHGAPFLDPHNDTHQIGRKMDWSGSPLVKSGRLHSQEQATTRKGGRSDVDWN